MADGLKTAIPASVKGLVDKDAPELSPVEQLGSATGFRAKRHSDITDVRELGREWQKANGNPQPETVYPPSKYLTLRNALEDRNVSKATQAYQELLKTAPADKVNKGFLEGLNKPFSGSAVTEPKFVASLKGDDLATYNRAMEQRNRIGGSFQAIARTFPLTPGQNVRTKQPARLPAFAGF